MLKAKLVVVGGDAKAKEVNLRLPCIIGRGREATLTLPHPLVSRQHTEITERDGRLYVKDLGSLNGTFLNNQRLEKEEQLEPNQLLTLGNVTFRAVYVVGTSASDSDFLDQVESIPTSSDPEPVKNSLADKETVYDEESKSNLSSDTDKSIISEESTISERRFTEENPPEPVSTDGASNIFVAIEGVDKVAPASSIEGLPDAPSAMSFAGGIDMAGDTQPEAQAVDSAELGFAAESEPKQEEGSRLDSFIKKLPR